MSYKSLIRTVSVGHSKCLTTDTLYPISAHRMNYSDFHKNRVRYNINTTNKAKSKSCYYLDT